MKDILITQSVLYSKKRGFTFLLSKDWHDYAEKINIKLIPYDFIFSEKKLRKLNLKGVIFTGGNDLYKKNKKKENLFRDNREVMLLKYMIKNNYRILGICRGFQLISDYFKSELIKKNGHVKMNHVLNLYKSKFTNKKILKVNSFHNYCITNLPKKFNVISKSSDETIEIAENISKNILCFMFHPERKNPSQIQINNYIKFFFRIK